MASNNKFRSDTKKGIPGGFLLFILAMILIIFTVQSLFSDKKGRVAFSHQLEHLVNLDLIYPQHNRKVADNDNLVTFYGKFREQQTEEAKERFKYLELLSRNHDLVGEKRHLIKDLDKTKENVKSSVDWFLRLSGISLPKGGLVIVGDIYDTYGRANSIVIDKLPNSNGVSLKDIEKDYQTLQRDPDQINVQKLNQELDQLTKQFRSPKLGIGSQSFKRQLQDIENRLEGAKSSSWEEQFQVYGSLIAELGQISTSLLESKKGVCLLPLRSVRSYMELVDQYNKVEEQLEKNEALLDKSRQNVSQVIWFFNNKELSTKSLEKQDVEAFNHWFAQAKKEWQNFSSNKALSFKAPDQPRNAVLEKRFTSEEPSPNYMNYIFLSILPVVLVVLVLYFLFSRQMKGVGSSAMNFGKSPARLLAPESNKVTFRDVAGAEESKEELQEIVDFLKDPQKFTSLGARIPKGVLLVGPPGTGKTLIAKAVAGEADRPFFSISGSDFVEMFVGVGASRIRDLFDQAKKNSPCIIFMDEIDAVGRHRGAGIGGGHDEREQTLNQLLVEMDGFDTKEGVILMAATNRPDILDKALLRPGRFDRRVVLDLPDVKGRYEILKVHARKIKMDDAVNLRDIARNTPGASGADLENILNEAALLAARRGRSAVTPAEVTEACDKVRFGKERRSLEMDENEKRTTAFHESGHVMVGLNVKYTDPIDKVTIIPRGFALGATYVMPQKNRLSYWKREVLDQLAFLMGGRAAEEVFVDDMSSGAQQDIAQATKLARSMVCEWGMSDLGTISYEERGFPGQYLGVTGYHERSYSDETAQKIDHEVEKLINQAHQRAKEIIEKEKDKVHLMADMLMEFETLFAEDIKEIMDGSWDVNRKKERLKMADSLQKKLPPPPPKEEEKKPLTPGTLPPRPQQI